MFHAKRDETVRTWLFQVRNYMKLVRILGLAQVEYAATLPEMSLTIWYQDLVESGVFSSHLLSLEKHYNTSSIHLMRLIGQGKVRIAYYRLVP